jgi:hypothetical protein
MRPIKINKLEQTKAKERTGDCKSAPSLLKKPGSILELLRSPRSTR